MLALLRLDNARATAGSRRKQLLRSQRTARTTRHGFIYTVRSANTFYFRAVRGWLIR